MSLVPLIPIISMTIRTTKFAEEGGPDDTRLLAGNTRAKPIYFFTVPCDSAPPKRHFKHGESSDPQSAGCHIMYLPEVASIINPIALYQAQPATLPMRLWTFVETTPATKYFCFPPSQVYT